MWDRKLDDNKSNKMNDIYETIIQRYQLQEPVRYLRSEKQRLSTDYSRSDLKKKKKLRRSQRQMDDARASNSRKTGAKRPAAEEVVAEAASAVVASAEVLVEAAAEEVDEEVKPAPVDETALASAVSAVDVAEVAPVVVSARVVVAVAETSRRESA